MLTMMKTKMYKSGQLLTIDGKVYRVKRARGITGICHYCDAWNECLGLNAGNILCIDAPVDCYLQLVKSKPSHNGKD